MYITPSKLAQIMALLTKSRKVYFSNFGQDTTITSQPRFLSLLQKSAGYFLKLGHYVFEPYTLNHYILSAYGKRPLMRPRRRGEDNIKIDLEDVEWGDRD
jgi:hypothetical protein